MFFISINLTKRAFWLINKNDPPVFPLQSRKDWFLLNPLLFTFADRSALSYSLHVSIDDYVLLETMDICFVFLQKIQFNNEELDKTSQYVASLIASFRLVSKQAELAGVSIEELRINDDLEEIGISDLPNPSFPVASGVAYMKKYYVDTAIRWKHLEIADKLTTNNNQPIYETLLLDAIQALQASDYRRSILFAAIAMDTMASTELDTLYNAFLTHGDPSGMLRIVSFQRPKGVEVKKDPIYAVLSSTEKFPYLIHELPLYLMKRSMLLEKEALYQKALMLYHTRNKIVHQGEPPRIEKTKYVEINEKGAREAIDCCLEVFQWFGIPNTYYVPEFAFIKAKKAVEIR